VGFSRKSDLSDYKGIFIHYDGSPENVIPSITFFIHLYGFTELVKLIKADHFTYRGWNEPIEVLNTQAMLEPYPEEADGTVTFADFARYDYQYIVKSQKTINVYKWGKFLKSFSLKMDWNKIEKKIFEYLFDSVPGKTFLRSEDAAIIYPKTQALGLAK
jgi:hypothetical protein